MQAITDRPHRARFNLFHSILFITLTKLNIPLALARCSQFSKRDIAFALSRTFPYLSWMHSHSRSFHLQRAWSRPILLTSLLRKDSFLVSLSWLPCDAPDWRIGMGIAASVGVFQIGSKILPPNFWYLLLRFTRFCHSGLRLVPFLPIFHGR